MRGAWVLLGMLALMVPAQLLAEDVLTVANRLAGLHLPYAYGSQDPRDGGLDCSGFVQMVFRESAGIDLPDEADKQLEYCHANGQVWDASSAWTPAILQPGDLVFFVGPEPHPRTSQVSHVMIYCGNNIMVGAQSLGQQLDGTPAGVGYYYLPSRKPVGLLGESGERLLGHRLVFAYARLKASVGALPPAILAALQPAVLKKEQTPALAEEVLPGYD